MSENGPRTHENLKQAFLLECMTASRYQYFSKIAEIEGFPEIAEIFNELADCVKCNAHGNMDYLKMIGDPHTGMPIGETKRNMAASVEAELRDNTDTYPAFAAMARAEGFLDIASWFETLMKHKLTHTKRLKEAMACVVEKRG